MSAASQVRTAKRKRLENAEAEPSLGEVLCVLAEQRPKTMAEFQKHMLEWQKQMLGTFSTTLVGIFSRPNRALP